MTTYLRVWIALLLLTGVEVMLAYLQTPPAIMLAALMGLSLLKAALIVCWFMHLKFERRSLALAIFPMLFVCILLLLVLLPDAQRALEMRSQ